VAHGRGRKVIGRCFGALQVEGRERRAARRVRQHDDLCRIGFVLQAKSGKKDR
jgi:hypothetical protein